MTLDLQYQYKGKAWSNYMSSRFERASSTENERRIKNTLAQQFDLKGANLDARYNAELIRERLNRVLGHTFTQKPELMPYRFYIDSPTPPIVPNRVVNEQFSWPETQTQTQDSW